LALTGIHLVLRRPFGGSALESDGIPPSYARSQPEGWEEARPA
jgi:hypothetical protein